MKESPGRSPPGAFGCLMCLKQPLHAGGGKRNKLSRRRLPQDRIARHAGKPVRMVAPQDADDVADVSLDAAPCRVIMVGRFRIQQLRSGAETFRIPVDQ